MSSFLRQASLVARQVPRTRTFASSSVSRKDLVQDLYLRELKGYTPPVLAKDAHVGAVKQFSLPPTPKAPALPADLAAELTAYDAAEPVAAAAPQAASSESAEETATGADAFLSFLEADVAKPQHHH